MHPGEYPASHAVNGIIDFLLNEFFFLLFINNKYRNDARALILR